MLRYLSASVACVILVACDATPQDALSEVTGQESLIEQIKSGSPKACSADEVKALVIDLMTPDYEPGDQLLRQDIEVGLHKVVAKLDAITLDSVDKDVGGVSCDANVVISTPNSANREFSITYLVRPSAESDDQFVVRGDFGDAATSLAALTSAAISDARNDRLAAANASAVNTEDLQAEDDLAEENSSTMEESAPSQSEDQGNGAVEGM